MNYKIFNEEPVNKAVREHELYIDDWILKPVSEKLYLFFDLFNKEFFAGQLGTPVISFRHTNYLNLGTYTRGRNEFGVYDNININPINLCGTIQETLVTLLHEIIHAWQWRWGKPSKSKYHNKACRRKMAELGIPCNELGVTLKIQDPFVCLIRKYGIDGQKWELPAEYQILKQKGSKLRKWVCSCDPQYAVRVAIQDFKATCLRCNSEFRLCQTKSSSMTN